MSECCLKAVFTYSRLRLVWKMIATALNDIPILRNHCHDKQHDEHVDNPHRPHVSAFNATVDLQHCNKSTPQKRCLNLELVVVVVNSGR
eukprot:m.75779 g.75779  ORF g.75779 m.75779 type:complete len:89 (+) comp12523_c0_seq1:950-1216(+)